MIFFRSISAQGQMEVISKELLKKIDGDLAISSSINNQYFDNLIKEYPQSDYLIGMKGYYLLYNESALSAKSYVEGEIAKNKKLHNGSYTNMVLGLVDENDNSKEQLLLKSVELDRAELNKWVRLELFYHYEKKESHLNAIRYLEMALKIDPYFPNAAIELVNISIDSNNISNAKQTINSLINKHPTYTLSYMYNAKFLIDEGKFQEAITNYETILKMDSLNIDALIGIGYVNQYYKDNKDEALKYYNLAWEIDKNNSIILKRLGILMSDRSDFEKAIHYLKQSLQFIAEYETYTELVYVYIKMLKLNEANSLLSECVSKYGNDRRTDFFDIIITHLNNDKLSTENKINSFHELYSKEDFEWLEEQLLNWKIEIKQ